jgi:Tol biopolymer transport system component
LLRVALAVGALALVAAVGALWLARPSEDEAGKGIVFQAKVHGLYQLFRIDPDGRGLKQLTHLDVRKSRIPGVEKAAWSPDGKRIVFDSDYRRTKYRVNSLYSMKPDGTDLEQLPIELGRFTGAPAYSPDGKLLSFDWDASNEKGHQLGIYIASADGSQLRRLTRIEQPNALVGASNWSPDGRWLVFTQNSGAREGVIVRMRPDGTGRRELTRWALNAGNAKWSPDGSRIAFNSYNGPHRGESSNVFTMKPDGSRLVQLTHYRGDTRNAFVGGWSPDGRQLLVHVRGAEPDAPGLNELFVMDADSGRMRRLTHLPRGSNPGYASWSPAG